MQSIKWLAFCVSQSMSRSVLHFFPSCDNASAPYAASCALTLITPGSPHATNRPSVMLEGGRLGHPDGLRLEDAFPSLRKDAMGLFGLEVEISTPQPRLDVRSSGCIIELLSQSLPVRFVPKKIFKAERSVQKPTLRLPNQKPSVPANAEQSESSVPEVSAKAITSAAGIAVRDTHHTPSLIVVNASALPMTAAIYGMNARPEASSQSAEAAESVSHELPLGRIEVEPGATQELAFNEEIFRSAANHDFVAGRCGTLPFAVEVTSVVNGLPMAANGEAGVGASGGTTSATATQVGLFLIHREAQTRRISSVLTL